MMNNISYGILVVATGTLGFSVYKFVREILIPYIKLKRELKASNAKLMRLRALGTAVYKADLWAPGATEIIVNREPGILATLTVDEFEKKFAQLLEAAPHLVEHRYPDQNIH